MTSENSETLAYRSFYPRRFAAARFYDKERKKHVEVPLHDEDDYGVHQASASANRKKRKKKADGDDTAADRRSLAQLESSVSKPFNQADVQQIIQRTQASVLHWQKPRQTPYERTFVHHTNEISWRMDQVELVEQIALNVPMVAACISTLKKLVMADGLLFRRDNIELVPLRDFREYMVQRLYPFAYDCIDSLLLLGVIPIAYEIDPTTGQCWPYVPARGTYVIKQHTIRGAVQYRFYWSTRQTGEQGWTRRMMKTPDGVVRRYDGRLECGMDADEGGIYDPTVTIRHNLGYPLLANGSLTSKVATLIDLAQKRMRVERARTVAEANASAPPLVLEYDNSAAEAVSQGMQQGYFADAGGPTNFADGAVPAESIEEMTYKRGIGAQQAYAGLMRYYESASGRDAGAEFGVRHQEYRSQIGGTAAIQPTARNSEGLPARWRDTFHINPMHKLANLPNVSVSSDYVNVLQYLDAQVCAIMGVPESHVLGTVDGRAGTEIVTNRLADEVRSLKNTLTDVLTHVYNKIFLEEDISDYIAQDSARRQRAGDKFPASLTAEKLRVSSDIKQTVLTFAKKPSETPEELKILYGLKAIDKHTYASELARRNGFDPAQLCTADECSDEDLELEDEKREFFIPELVEWHKMQFEEKKHTEGMEMQREQNEMQQQMQREQTEAQQDMKREDNKSKEKQAATKGADSPAAGAKKKKSPSLADQSTSEGWTGPSKLDISAAASVLANAGAAAKKKKKDEEGGEKKKAKKGED